MLRPFWCNDSTAALRTLDDWPFMHGDFLPVPRHRLTRYLKNRARLSNTIQRIVGLGGPVVPVPFFLDRRLYARELVFSALDTLPGRQKSRRLADCRCGGRSASLWFGEANACRRRVGPGQCWRSTPRRAEHDDQAICSGQRLSDR
jgi:hypothetical protein